jgi:hypothetical protein
MLLADFSAASLSVVCYARGAEWGRKGGKGAHLIGGGAEGINIDPDELGCLTNNSRIRMTTKHGNKRTTPSGTEMAELPLSLSGRRR